MGQLTMVDMLKDELGDSLVAEIIRPEKKKARQLFTKECMLDFFKRNLTRANQEKQLPRYLMPFNLEENLDEDDTS